MPSDFPLDQILTTQDWYTDSEPIRHCIVRNVFQDHFYKALENAFVEFVTQTIVNQGGKEYLDSRNQFVFGINHKSPEPLGVFLTEEWSSKIAGLFNLNCTKDITISAHVHKPGDLSSAIHNDFNPAWFAKEEGDSMNIANNNLCNYKTGETRLNVKTKKLIRTCVMVYFLNNADAEIVTGGETALYGNIFQGEHTICKLIRPQNNTLIAFPCHPNSYHAFISNKSHQRCSIAMWLHSDYNETISIWGKENVSQWR